MKDDCYISSDVSPTSLSFTKEDFLHRLLKHPDFGGPNKTIPGKGRAIIHVAVNKDDCELITFLLAHPELDVNIPDQYDETPLMSAVGSGKLKAVRLLLQHKDIDVNLRGRGGYWTALRYAKLHKRYDIVDLLLSHGAIDYDSEAPTTVPTAAHIDNPPNFTLQPDNEANFDAFDDDMDDAPTEAWEEFLDMGEGMEE
ncbi:hypothetical protein J4E80_009842 [Alternaria sp. BMP 0032]|nr:hypothetical protein J4E80_009842 [Alternaria sp. BMP 0032]